MTKWLKRLILYPILLFSFIVAVFLFFNKNLFYTLKGFYGSQIQWFGYDVKGSEIVEESLSKISNPSAELYHNYSVQNTKNGNYDEAIKYLNKAAEIDPKNVDGYFGWCLLYYYRDYEKALFHLNRLDTATTFVDYVGDDNILYAKGLCFKGLENYTKALELFKEAIEYEIMEHGESWINHQMLFQTGRVLHLMKKPKEAIEYYDKALLNWDGSSESLYYKGLAELELGKESGCSNLKEALYKVRQGIKSTDSYVKLFDEVYTTQIEETIKFKCK